MAGFHVGGTYPRKHGWSNMFKKSGPCKFMILSAVCVLVLAGVIGMLSVSIQAGPEPIPNYSLDFDRINFGASRGASESDPDKYVIEDAIVFTRTTANYEVSIVPEKTTPGDYIIINPAGVDLAGPDDSAASNWLKILRTLLKSHM